jgi:hypothetical protein
VEIARPERPSFQGFGYSSVVFQNQMFLKVLRAGIKAGSLGRAPNLGATDKKHLIRCSTACADSPPNNPRG